MAGYEDETTVMDMFTDDAKGKMLRSAYNDRKNSLLASIPEKETINDILLTDMNVVLSNDMLMKVDLMSMANGLEVRVPFLDYEVVNFMFSLPDSYKINK